jgi:hypothetical protein
MGHPAGRPLGTADFVAALERSILRLLAPQKGGRPKKPGLDSRQSKLSFVAFRRKIGKRFVCPRVLSFNEFL